MSDRRILVSVAHPDDESFGLGGLISHYVNAGVDVYLICATNGDVGTVSPELLNGYNSIAELRLSELDCATEKLGFKKVFKLGYKDSGMMGSETSQDPDCLWYQSQHDPENVTRRVVEVIREVRPQVVITFNRYGGYGHPDHIAIQRATTDAFELAGQTDYLTDEQLPYRPQKLYYTRFPTLILRLGIWLWRLRGKDPRRVGRNNDIDLPAILDHVEPTHTQVDIRDFLEAWEDASACHASQGGGRASNRIPYWLRRRLSFRQTLTRVFPVPEQDKVDEYDLFTGIQRDALESDAVQ